jgi:histidinol phosphatase-like PHP family hydrolase
MIDLHTHSIFSDGDLIPTELVRRAEVAGCRTIAITDHTDHSNYDLIIPRIVRVCEEINTVSSIRVIPGVELTHLYPAHIPRMVKEVRAMGARIVVVHGETIAEPVMPGTNLAAIQAGADILAHPGLISEDEVRLAAERGVYLEVSARKGHSLTNGHVVRLARKTGAKLVLNTDGHSPSDLIGKEFACKVAQGAGMTEEEIPVMFQNSEVLAGKVSR